HVRRAHGGRRPRPARRVDLPLRHPHPRRGEGGPPGGRGPHPSLVGWLPGLLGVYARGGRRGVEPAGQNWWLGLLLVPDPGALVGGFIATFAMAALTGSWFALVGQVVRQGRVAPADVPGSFGVHLWDVLTFGFLLMILQRIAGIAFKDSQYLTIVFELAVFVF